ncbi:factor associated with metabolism and energy-like [Heterodontus francisci]|uniref:factor associated with metabolism and energy-like n=1 Tax=Heterodontus francisci TaxID=7792 RepID=UPI00355C1519
MGSGSSKAHHKVIKVTPVPAAEADTFPTMDRDGISTSRGADVSHWLVTAGDCLTHSDLKAAAPSRRSELPPLKGAGCGTRTLPSLRQVPRTILFDTTLDNRETSIIKKHPPRRFERLEPINSCTVITSEKLLEKQRVANACKAQEQEMQGEIAKQFSSRQQQIQKIQYENKQRQQEIIHLQEQTELKRSLHLETHNNKQKINDLKAKKARERAQNNNHQEDQYYIAIEHDETFNTDDDNPWNDLITPMLFINDNFGDNNHFRICKQLVKHQTQQNTFSNSSSNESLDYWMDNTRQSQHRLMRTKTERIPVFDEFFDQEL